MSPARAARVPRAGATAAAAHTACTPAAAATMEANVPQDLHRELD